MASRKEKWPGQALNPDHGAVPASTGKLKNLPARQRQLKQHQERTSVVGLSSQHCQPPSHRYREPKPTPTCLWERGMDQKWVGKHWDLSTKAELSEDGASVWVFWVAWGLLSEPQRAAVYDVGLQCLPPYLGHPLVKKLPQTLNISWILLHLCSTGRFKL